MEYKKSLETNPEVSVAQDRLLNLLKGQGTPDELKTFKEKIFSEAKKEKNINPYLAEAGELIAQKRYDLALEFLNKAKEIEPNNALIYNDRGWIYLTVGKTKEAMDDFEKALTLDPGCTRALVNLGTTYQRLKRWKESKRYLEKASHLDPKNPAIYYLLGVSELELHENDNAKRHLKAALHLKPDYEEAKIMLEKIGD